MQRYADLHRVVLLDSEAGSEKSYRFLPSMLGGQCITTGRKISSMVMFNVMLTMAPAKSVLQVERFIIVWRRDT
jgi:hypothetical protein